MFHYRALLLFLLVIVFHSSAAPSEAEEPWEELFNGKNFDGWKDVNCAKVVKGEAVVSVPPKMDNSEASVELAYERSLPFFELEYEFKVDEGVDHSLWFELDNGELRQHVELRRDRVAPRKWHKLRVEHPANGEKGRTLLNGEQIGDLVSSPQIIRFAFSADQTTLTSTAWVRKVRLLDLTTSISPGARASDRMFSNLKGLPRLTDVDVSGSSVTDKTLECLARFKNLRTLKVRGTRVTQSGLRRFKEAVPECEIDP